MRFIAAGRRIGRCIRPIGTVCQHGLGYSRWSPLVVSGFDMEGRVATKVL